MLAAKRHPMVDYLVYVTTDDPATPAPNNVVAKHNTRCGGTWRTKHVGPKPSLSDIRAAIAEVV